MQARQMNEFLGKSYQELVAHQQELKHSFFFYILTLIYSIYNG